MENGTPYGVIACNEEKAWRRTKRADGKEDLGPADTFGTRSHSRDLHREIKPVYLEGNNYSRGTSSASTAARASFAEKSP